MTQLAADNRQANNFINIVKDGCTKADVQFGRLQTKRHLLILVKN